MIYHTRILFFPIDTQEQYEKRKTYREDTRRDIPANRESIDMSTIPFKTPEKVEILSLSSNRIVEGKFDVT